MAEVCLGSTSTSEKRAVLSAIDFSYFCCFVVSVRRSLSSSGNFGKYCVILLWHSRDLPYNYYDFAWMSYKVDGSVVLAHLHVAVLMESRESNNQGFTILK